MLASAPRYTIAAMKRIVFFRTAGKYPSQLTPGRVYHPTRTSRDDMVMTNPTSRDQLETLQ